MDQGNGYTEFDLGAVLKRVKRDPYGPQQRAAKVLNILAAEGITNWDAFCFAVEYVASMVSVLPFIELPAKDLVRNLYIAHYVRFEGVSWLDQQTLAKTTEDRPQSSAPDGDVKEG